MVLSGMVPISPYMAAVPFLTNDGSACKAKTISSSPQFQLEHYHCLRTNLDYFHTLLEVPHHLLGSLHCVGGKDGEMQAVCLPLHMPTLKQEVRGGV